MKFSATLFQTGPVADWLHSIKAAESEGFEQVWVGDSHMIWREAYVTLTAALLNTSRLRIGLAVTNPVTRDISVTASAFATLAEVSDGRAVLGIGLGDSALETIGKEPARLAELERALEGLRTLLSKEAVPMGDADARLSWLPARADVPIFIGGSGPKMLKLMGKHGDGVILMAGAHTDLLQTAIERVMEGSEGRRPYSVAWVPASVLPDGQQARDNVRGHVARCATHALAWDFPPEDEKLIQKLRDAYDYYGHLFPASPQADLVPDRLVDLFAIAGTPEEARQRVDELRDAPVDEIAFVLHGDDRELQLRLLARDVLGL